VKTLFFGTSAFAVPSLRVVAERTQCAGAVTQPDRPAGRGHRLQSSPVKRAALDLGLPVYEPLQLRNFAREMSGEGFDLFALASYGRILPRELLALPRLGALNVHPSLLPKYRGATPIQNAILHGEPETGVSIMLMDAGLDTGDIVLQERLAIERDESYGELHDRLAALGAQLLAQCLVLAERGELAAHPQSGEPTLTRPIVREDLRIDLSWAPERVVRAVRAYAPQPAARAEINGEIVKILRAHVGDSGELVIDELIAPNRGRMSGASFDRLRMTKAKGGNG
jgi:methionyl-tRNA formyltransferase